MGRVLIVGAGPTGLTAAVELARKGQSVDIIEKRNGPSHLSRAVGIQVKSMDILQVSGAADGINAEARLHDLPCSQQCALSVSCPPWLKWR